MKNIKLPAKLFDLSQSDIATSQMIYAGKTIKFLIAPFHTYEQLEKMIPCEDTTTYLMPEKDLPAQNIGKFVSMIVALTDNTAEYKIITASQNVIQDMVDTSTRVLTEDGRIVDCPIKTFMANIHDIKYSIFENEDFMISEKVKQQHYEEAKLLMEEIENITQEGCTLEEYQNFEQRIDLIGEEILTFSLRKRLKLLKYR